MPNLVIWRISHMTVTRCIQPHHVTITRYTQPQHQEGKTRDSNSIYPTRSSGGVIVGGILGGIVLIAVVCGCISAAIKSNYERFAVYWFHEETKSTGKPQPRNNYQVR
ncbi:Hypothetical predicted protein [Mytilus galloprovincialis]|uniref:Uncharacterized protein n=1 Tax=Mytilus galloprovincialis TaxID=29158 RepID=A0A8B6C0I7_MYTGA|nr:Hypothetical predicted protein [Mytilus galloprovincialis]